MFNLFGHAKAVEAKAKEVAEAVLQDVKGAVEALSAKVEELAAKVAADAPGVEKVVEDGAQTVATDSGTVEGDVNKA